MWSQTISVDLDRSISETTLEFPRIATIAYLKSLIVSVQELDAAGCRRCTAERGVYEFSVVGN